MMPLTFLLGDAVEPVRVSVGSAPARLSDVVPLAQRLASRLSQAACDRSRREGAPVSCRKGCGACCRYLVPLSVPEAFRLAEDVAEMPAAWRKTVQAGFTNAALRVLSVTAPDAAGLDAAARNEQTGRWYQGLDIPCPLLREEACDFYSRRPIACREHLVNSPVSLCAGVQPGKGRTVDLPISLLNALAQLAAEVEGRDVEAVLLPLSLGFAEVESARRQRTWPAKELFGRFAAIVNRATREARAAA